VFLLQQKEKEYHKIERRSWRTKEMRRSRLEQPLTTPSLETYSGRTFFTQKKIPAVAFEIFQQSLRISTRMQILMKKLRFLVMYHKLIVGNAYVLIYKKLIIFFYCSTRISFYQNKCQN